MNIWEVVCVKDLSKILKESPNKFVIIGLVLDVNEKKIHSYIKKFLKEKSQILMRSFNSDTQKNAELLGIAGKSIEDIAGNMQLIHKFSKGNSESAAAFSNGTWSLIGQPFSCAYFKHSR